MHSPMVTDLISTFCLLLFSPGLWWHLRLNSRIQPTQMKQQLESWNDFPGSQRYLIESLNPTLELLVSHPSPVLLLACWSAHYNGHGKQRFSNEELGVFQLLFLMTTKHVQITLRYWAEKVQSLLKLLFWQEAQPWTISITLATQRRRVLFLSPNNPASPGHPKES